MTMKEKEMKDGLVWTILGGGRRFWQGWEAARIVNFTKRTQFHYFGNVLWRVIYDVFEMVLSEKRSQFFECRLMNA